MIRRLYARFRQLIHEGFKFLVIGAVGFIVTFGVANALHPIGKYKAITIATILATAITYLGNRYWTFRHREGKGTTRDSTMFFVLNGVGLLIYYGCIGLIDLAGLGHSVAWYNVALVVGTGLGTLFRFWSYRKWIWHERPVLAHGEPAEEEAHDLAAVVGAVPVGEEPTTGWGAFTGRSANGATADGASANGSARNGASAANGAGATGAGATGASANGAARNHAGATDAVGDAPHSHARPGRPSVRPPSEREREPGGHIPASHRRTS
jgi:putative flippase GtrA